jgi:hypothetical protein
MVGDRSDAHRRNACLFVGLLPDDTDAGGGRFDALEKLTGSARGDGGARRACIGWPAEPRATAETATEERVRARSACSLAARHLVDQLHAGRPGPGPCIVGRPAEAQSPAVLSGGL